MPAKTDLQRALCVLVLALSMALGVGCGRDEAPVVETPEPASEPQRGGTLVLASVSDAAGWIEYISPATRLSQELTTHLFLRLVEEQPDFEEHPPTVAPMLAESWEWEGGQSALVFRLRKEARWSDGEPLTARDVRFTWLAQTHPDVGWVDSHIKDSIDDVEIVDDHTVRFHFNSVNPHLLLDANEGGILPEHVFGQLPFEEWRQNAPWFEENLVVSGPFLLETWAPQREIVLSRNPNYYDPRYPYLDRVVIRIIPDRASQLTQLLAGQLDVMESLGSSDIEQVQDAGRFNLPSYWSRNYFFVGYRADNPLFATPELRRALTLAIDRESIVEAVYGKWGKVGVGPILTTVWAFNRDLEPLPYDPEEARRLLAAEGFAPGEDGVLVRGDGQRFSFELVSNIGNQQRSDAMVLIQEQLRRVGIEVEQRLIEFNSMGVKLTNGDFEAMMLGLAMPTDLDLEYAYHSQGGSNFFGYSNPELDEVIDQMAAVTTYEELGERVGQAQAILHRDQPMTFLWEAQRVHAFDRRVRGAEPNLLRTYWHLWRWWIDPAVADAD